MKYVGQTVRLLLVLCCAAGCGRIRYDLLPEDSNDLLFDAAVDAALDIDVSEPFADAATNEDTATSEDAASGDAGGMVDAGPDDSAADAADVGTDGDGSLVLRYDFTGTGTTVRDSVGADDGLVLGGAQLDGNGGLTLDGSDDFVDIPNGVVSNLTSATIVAWLEWAGGPCWQRVFDFGSSDAGEGNAGNATSALSMTASSCGDNVVTTLVELDGDLWAATGTALPTGRLVQLALVVDGVAAQLRMYMDGVQVSQAAMPIRLSQLRDENNWLGRSQWIQDRYLRARYDELRIYARPLSAAEIADLHMRGPDLP